MKKLFIILLMLPALFTHAQNAVTREQALANEIISNMGGIDNFNGTNYIGWNYFGYRRLIWDKVNDRVRIDYLNKPVTIITSLHSEEGKVFIQGEEITQPDTLKKYLAKGKKVWMNDSYWLLMPFKLADKGVNLKYAGTDTTLDGRKAEVIEMTFNNVGATPDNKYLIYMDEQTRLISQWAFYEKYTDEKPAIVNTWGDYQTYGNILLPADRGAEGKLSEIHVWKNLPESVFNDMKIPSFDALEKIK